MTEDKEAESEGKRFEVEFQLPPDLARSPAGTTVEGQVRTAGSDGRVVVRTDQGDVRLQLGRTQVAELLQTGTRVTLTIQSPGAQPPEP